MINLYRKESIKLVFISFFIFYFFGIIANRFFVFFDSSNIFLFKIINFCFEIYLIVILFFNKKKDLILPLLIVIIFLCGQILLKDGFYDKFSLELINSRQGKIYLNLVLKYVYVFLFIGVFKIIGSKQLIQYFFKCILWLFILNSFLVVIGFIFNIEFFKTYFFSDRFGYSGFLSSVYIYCFLILYLYKEFKRKKINIFMLLYCIIISLLMGKKAMLFFNIMFIGSVILFEFKDFRKLIIFSFFIIGMLLGLFFHEIMGYVIQYFPFWNDIYIEKGGFAVLSSLRTEIFMDYIQQIESNWSFWNYLFGGLNFPDYWVEFELVSLITLFGIFGTSIYVYFLRIQFMNLPKKDLVLIALVFCTALLMGGFFIDIYVITMFCLFIFYLKDYNRIIV